MKEREKEKGCEKPVLPIWEQRRRREVFHKEQPCHWWDIWSDRSKNERERNICREATEKKRQRQKCGFKKMISRRTWRPHCLLHQQSHRMRQRSPSHSLPLTVKQKTKHKFCLRKWVREKNQAANGQGEGRFEWRNSESEDAHMLTPPGLDVRNQNENPNKNQRKREWAEEKDQVRSRGVEKGKKECVVEPCLYQLNVLNVWLGDGDWTSPLHRHPQSPNGLRKTKKKNI